MICLICRDAELIIGFTSVNFERGEIQLKIDRVPAWICPSCGESYLEEDVTVRLLSEAEEMVIAGMIEGIQNFS